MTVGAILRLAQGQGGTGAIIAKGDETSGNLLIEILERGVFRGVFERVHVDLDTNAWTRLAPDETEAGNYFERRRKSDPDIWLMELNVPDAAQLIAVLPT